MDVTKFEELQLDDRIIRAITEMGFEEASPIQAQAIPVVLEGRDMIGQAQTGTGKTAAFGLPLLPKVDPVSYTHLATVVPFLARFILSAPRFCPTKVVTARPILWIGSRQNLSSFP